MNVVGRKMSQNERSVLVQLAQKAESAEWSENAGECRKCTGRVSVNAVGKC
jgi:hypothetical protein